VSQTKEFEDKLTFMFGLLKTGVVGTDLETKIELKLPVFSEIPNLDYNI
jgi:hypothetical protein